LNHLFEKYSEEMRNSSKNQDTYKYQLETMNKKHARLEAQQMDELTKKVRFQAEIEVSLISKLNISIDHKYIYG